MVMPKGAAAGKASDGDIRLCRLGRRLAVACTMLAVAFPLAVAWSFASADPAHRLVQAGVPATTDPNTWQWVAADALTLVPVLLYAAALLAARRCFRLFGHGHYLTTETVDALRAFGGRIAASGMAGLALPTVIGLVLTAANPPGERILVLGVGSGPVRDLLFGAVLWAIAAVMARAVAIAEEHAQIV